MHKGKTQKRKMHKKKSMSKKGGFNPNSCASLARIPGMTPENINRAFKNGMCSA